MPDIRKSTQEALFYEESLLPINITAHDTIAMSGLPQTPETAGFGPSRTKTAIRTTL
jgi:hypothetical protein